MNNQEIENKVKEIVKNNIPSEFYININQSKKFYGGEYLQIFIGASDHDINNVKNQKPQAVSLSLDFDTLELQTQSYGGMGGGSITRQPDKEHPKEKYLVMKSVKVPFRKPKKTEKAVFKAIERFCNRYVQLLKDNVEILTHQDLVNYEKILS